MAKSGEAGDQLQVEDIKCVDNNDHDGVGEDFTDSYAHTSGYIYVLRKVDPTGYPEDYYRIEVQPEKWAKPRGNRLQQIIERSVTNMSKAEHDLRAMFGYAYHKSTEAGWFEADSPEEVKSKCLEVLEKWSNTEAK